MLFRWKNGSFVKKVYTMSRCYIKSEHNMPEIFYRVRICAADLRPVLLVCLLLVLMQPVRAKASEFVGPITPKGNDSAWVSVPAGARPAYIGIHGGTVPVSLLTARDGTSMVTFVGQTGNDFLRILRRMDITPPAELPKSAVHESTTRMSTVIPGSNATILKADTPVGNIPVFYVTGRGFARMDLPSDQWLPFGLSETPLSLEGQVAKPMHITKAKKYRHVLLPGSLKRSSLTRR